MAGFLKKLGAGVKSLGKMVAIKNVTKVVTGEWGDIAKEAGERVIKPFLAGGGVPNDKVATAAVTGLVAGTNSLVGRTSLGIELGKFGSTVADSTIKEWLKKNWWILVAVIAGLYAIFKTNLFGGGKRQPVRRRR